LLVPPPSWPMVVLLRLIPKQGAHSPFALLNQKIADLTREVMNRKRAEERTLQAIHVRDEFLAAASHEFKTPIHSLKLQLEIASRMLVTLDAFTIKRMEPKIEIMRRQVNRLALLSSGLMDLSVLRSGASSDLQNVDVSEVVRVSIDRMSSELTKAGCEVCFESQRGLTAILEPLRLEQILENLLSNAAKYGAGKPIVISVRAEGDSVAIAVTDKGLGISPKDLPRIFEKFERAVSSENYGGLGLGLFISRCFAEAMGGKIKVDSMLGQGSTFTVQFKRAPSLPIQVQQ
jgi:signal transduction histidine kinase